MLRNLQLLLANNELTDSGAGYSSMYGSCIPTVPELCPSTVWLYT